MNGWLLWLGFTAALAGDTHWVSAAPGEVHLSAHSGFPWHGVQAVYAPRGPLAVTARLETARFQRTEARIGLQRPWTVAPNWSVLALASVGGVHQTGGYHRQGPQISGEWRVSRLGRVEPYVSFHERHLFALQSIQVVTGKGDEYSWASTRYVSRGGTMGMRIPIRQRLCLDVALQAGRVDSSFALPSFSMGMAWRPQS